MTPEPWATIAGSAARLNRKVPSRFVRTMRSKSSTEWSMSRASTWMAALLTTMSRRPKSRNTSATIAATRASSPTSPSTPTASRRDAATARAPAPSRSTSTVRAPSAAYASAIARPMPRAAPVTMATRPSSRPMGCVSSAMCGRSVSAGPSVDISDARLGLLRRRPSRRDRDRGRIWQRMERGAPASQRPRAGRFGWPSHWMPAMPRMPSRCRPSGPPWTSRERRTDPS